MRLYQKILLVCLTCFFAIQSEAQNKIYNTRFTYKYNFQVDSSDIGSMQTEDMFLFVNNSHSAFKSKNYNLLDSVLKINTADVNMAIGFAQANRTDFKFTIIKDSTDMLKFIDILEYDKYMYVEKKNPFNWEIAEDTATIAGFHCQKATGLYGGRNWVAWFTSEIPISDGPYTFCGLPGLIVKINDTRNFFKFTLFEITRSPQISFDYKMAIKPIEKIKFYEALDYLNKNRFEMILLSGAKFVSGEQSIKDRIESKIKKYNNPIELIIANK